MRSEWESSGWQFDWSWTRGEWRQSEPAEADIQVEADEVEEPIYALKFDATVKSHGTKKAHTYSSKFNAALAVHQNCMAVVNRARALALAKSISYHAVAAKRREKKARS